MKRTIIIVCCILGMIVGVTLGEYLAALTPALKFLALGGQIGVKTPFVVDLLFMQFTFGLWLKVNICGVICMVIFACISKVILGWLKI